MRAALKARTLGMWILIWGAIGAVWMLFVDTLTVAETVAGILAAGLGTMATASLSAQHPIRQQLELRSVLALPRQLARIPVDLWLLARELGKALTGNHRGGCFYAVPFHGATDARSNGRRAVIELFGSLAPNTIVLGVDDQHTIVHQLSARHRERDALREISR